MATAKRLYLYGVSGVSLGLLLYAAWILMGLLLERLGSGYATSVLASTGSPRESLALAIGFIVVGLPLWLFHWAALERMVAGDGPAAAAERQSIVRGVYFGVVLLWISYVIATSGVDAVREAIARPLGATDPYYEPSISTSGAWSWLVVGIAAFVYHGWVRARDIRLGPTIQGAAAWGSRLFFYGVAAGAMAVALIAVASIVTTVGQALSGYSPSAAPNFGYGPGFGYLVQTATAPWWVRPLVGAITTVFVLGSMWLAYWWYARRLTAHVDQQGHDERLSRVRLTYFVAVVAVGVTFTLTGAAASLGVALRYVIGAWRVTTGQSIWGEVVVPLLATLPLVAGWWWHRRTALRQWSLESGSALAALRPIDYLTGLIGLAAFAEALVSFLTIITEHSTSSSVIVGVTTDAWRASAADAIGLLGVAISFWLVPWFTGQGRLLADPESEVRSTARRAYLFAVSGVTVLAGAFSLAAIVYRVTRIGVGLDSSTFGSDVRVPLCVLVVAAPLAAYHAYSLRRELAASLPAGVQAVVAEPAVAAAGVAPAVAPAVASEPVVSAAAVSDLPRELVIVGPAGADYEALRTSVAALLPDGYSIAVRFGEGPAHS